MNPEEVAIADGCVFFGLQAAVNDPDNNALMAQTVARVDLATGAATILTGSAPVAGRFSRISTSQCKAVWIWWNAQYANESSDSATMDLHYYNGTSLSTIDSGTGLGRPVIAQGRIFYTKKDAGGIAQPQRLNLLRHQETVFFVANQHGSLHIRQRRQTQRRLLQ